MSEQVAAPEVVNTPAPSAAAEATGVENKNPPTPPKAPEVYEVKINGQTRKYTLDELKNKVSLGEAANEKFQKASELSKKHESTKAELKKDFFKVLMSEEVGLTKEEMRTKFESWYKENFIDPETMDPREMRIRELEREKSEREAREQEIQAAKQKEIEEQETAKTVEQMQKEIISVVEKSGLPKTRFTAARVAYWMRQNLKNGYNAPEEVIVQQVREERNSLVGSMVKESTGEQLVEMLGEELVTKIRKYDIELLKKKLGGTTKGDDGFPAMTRDENKKVTTRDVDAYFNNLRRQKNS